MDEDVRRPEERAGLALAGWWRDLEIAAAFLTRLPIRTPDGAGMAALGGAARCFPIVGLGVGLLGGVVYAMAQALSLPPLLAAVLAVGAVVIATGALHEDGLADTADGLGGGRDRERKLAIMRDSRIGSYGVIALILMFALRIGAVAALADSEAVVAGLIAAHAGSRAFVAAVMWREPLARSDGLAAGAGRPGRTAMLWAAGIGALVVLIFAGVDAILAIGAGAVAALVIAWLARRQIGGVTGDILGAVQQGSEAAMLLALVAQG